MNQQANPHVLRVAAVVDSDTVFVSDVVEEYDACTALGANDRIVRSREMARAGANTFWKVDKETDSPERETDLPLKIGPLIHSTAMSFTNVRAASRSFVLPDEYTAKLKPASDVKSYKREKRLKIGFSLVTGAGSLDDLFGLGIAVPPGLQFHAIQLDADRWIAAESYSLAYSILRMARQNDRSSVAVYGLGGQAQTMELSSGVVLFVEEPRFETLGHQDLRTGAEIAADTDEWLEKISQSVKSTELDRSRIADLRAVLRNYMSETIDPGEMAQLTAAMRILESRSEIIGLIPEIVRRDGVWSELVEAQIGQETARMRDEIEASFDAQRRQLESELDQIRERTAAARSELEILGARKQAYDDASKNIEETIKGAVEKRIAGMAELGASGRAELETLAARIDALQSSIASQEPPAHRAAQDEALPVMNAEDRKVSAAALAKATGITLANFAVALSSRNTGRLPVLTGRAAGQAASRLVHGLSTSLPTIVYCDPTIVSLKDLLDAPGIDGESTLRSALERARSRPEILFPIGLLSLTKSACEYWLPALLAGQQGGQLPRNVLFVASTEADGSRIGVPASLLDRLLPLSCEPPDGGSPVLASAAWPATELSSAPKEFLLGLLDLGLENQQLRDVTKQATGLLNLFQCDVETFKAGLGAQMEWLGAVHQDGAKSHPQLRFFEASEA